MSCNAEDGPSALLWASVMAHCRGAAALAVASVSAAARDAVECSEGGFFLRGGSVLVAVRPRAVSLDFVEPLWNERERHIPLYHSLVRPAVPTRVMLCVNVGSEVCGEGGDDDDTWQESVPRALEASRWWLMWRTRAWGVPLAVRCLDTLVADVARDFLSHFRAGAVAALKVVVMQRRGELAASADVCGRLVVERRASRARVDVCLGPVLQEDATGAPWYEGLEELVVRAGHAFPEHCLPMIHDVGHVGLCGEDGTAALLHAPCLVRLVVEHATAASWIGELGALEELMLPAPEFTDGWDSLGELHALRRLSIEDAKIPKLSWLAGCPELEEVFLTRVRSVQDWQSLSLCPELKVVGLWKCRCSVGTWLKKCRSLQGLWLDDAWAGRQLPQLSDARRLRLFWGELPGNSLAPLFPMSELEVLSPISCRDSVSERDLCQLPESLRVVRFRSMWSVALPDGDVTADREAWYSRMPQLHALESSFTLESDHDRFKDGFPLMTVLGCPSLAGVQGWYALAPLPAKLRTLRLSHVDFTSGTVVPNAPGGWGEVVRFLAAAPCLEELRLEECAGIEALAGLCDAMPCLRSLTFEWCVMLPEPSWLGRGDSPTLEYLQICGGEGPMDLTPLRTLPALRTVSLVGGLLLNDAEAVVTPRHPEDDDHGCHNASDPVLIDLGWMQHLAGTLECLVLDPGAPWLPRDAGVLGYLSNLRHLELVYYHGESVAWLEGCPRVQRLLLNDAPLIGDWQALSALLELQYFCAYYSSLNTVAWVRHALQLKVFNYLGFMDKSKPHVKDYTPLLGHPSLSAAYVDYANRDCRAVIATLPSFEACESPGFLRS